MDEQFLRQLTKVKDDQRRITRFEKEIECNQDEIEKQLLDLNLAYLVSPDQNATEIDDPRLKRLSARDQNKKLLQAGKAAVKQKFSKLADMIDRHDLAVFRGEESGLKLANPVGSIPKVNPAADSKPPLVEKLLKASVTVHAVKGIHVPKNDHWDTWDIDNELRIDHQEADTKEDQDMREEEGSFPLVMGPEQRKLYAELDELADLVPEINDIQYTLKHQQLNTEQLKEHIYNLEYKANSF